MSGNEAMNLITVVDRLVANSDLLQTEVVAGFRASS